MPDIQYVSDETGNPTAVIVPIELWREIESEKETAYLLKSDNMKRRLLEAKERQTGVPFEEALREAWNLISPRLRTWPGGFNKIATKRCALLI